MKKKAHKTVIVKSVKVINGFVDVINELWCSGSIRGFEPLVESSILSSSVKKMIIWTLKNILV